MNFRKVAKLTGFALLCVFALIGFAFTAVFLAMQFDLLNVRGSIEERNDFFGRVLGSSTDACADNPCQWQETPEWTTVREGLRKDAAVINRAAQDTGVPSRLIAAVVVPEQLRFFTSEREIYKKVFEPLKILGSLSQFSLGISGIKQETAAEIDRRRGHYVDPQILFNRLTDPKDHYYSYLYTGLFIRQIMDEWETAGYPITDSGVVVTLFNIGFENSNPNPAPQIGGASIEVGGQTYLFGALGASFYNSGELLDVFPK